jgi:DNA (cytosine-5)-methyltransferase 1
MVMENVPGILDMVTPEGIPVIDALSRVLADGGWSTFDAVKRSLTSMHDASAAVRQEQTHQPARHLTDTNSAQAPLFDITPPASARTGGQPARPRRRR